MARKSTNPEQENSTINTAKENKTMMNRKIGMTAKDMINAKNSSVQLKSAPARFTCTGLAITTDVDRETGEMREVGYAVASDGTVYGTISNTAISSIDAIIDAVDDGDIELPCDLGVAMRKSNAGREFITISVF